MSRYAPWFEIAVAHAYFADGRCRGLRFAPTAGTAAWLRENGALGRETGSGLIVLAELGRRVDERAMASPLAWTMWCDDARFAAVTPGLPTRPDELMFFRAAVAPAAGDAVGFGEIRLHEGPEATARELWPITWPEISGQLGAAQRRVPPLALLQLKPPRPPEPPLSSAAPAKYTIRFGARATVWKYCLIGAWNGDALEVVAAPPVPAGEPMFDAPVREALDNGEPVLAFRSRQGIELRERSERRFQLRARAGDADRILVKRLPVAGADHFARETIHGVPTLVSEIFVHR